MGCCQSNQPPQLEPVFTSVRKLGSGTFADVCGEEVAVKLIRRGFDDFEARHISYEIQLQSLVASPHVVELKQLLLTKQYLGLVLEYIPSGTLDRYCKRHPPDEEVARFLLRQMVTCVSFLHKLQVVHRDLKLQNMLVAKTADGMPRIKLIDFGCAKRWKRRAGKASQFHTAYVGTPAYMSPQLLQASLKGEGNYDGVKVDVWCLGVMLVQLFASNHVPYSTDDYQFDQVMGEHFAVLERLRDMEKGKWKVSSPIIAKAAEGMSPELLDLLDRIFDPMESTRIELAGIESHAWTVAALGERYQSALMSIASESQTYSTAPKIIVDPVKQSTCTPDAGTGRYELVDDIVRMAARGRYVPKGEDGDGRIIVYNIGNLATNLDISVTAPTMTEGVVANEKPAAPTEDNTSNNAELVKTLTKTDPSTHSGNHFDVFQTSKAE